MNFIQAKNQILSLWRHGDSAYEKIKKEDYKQMYFAVFSQRYSGNDEWKNAIGKFLIRGAIAFDRFGEPRPNVVNEECYNMFCCFLSSLQKLDGKHFERTAFFHLERIQWDIYSKCSLNPCDENIKEFLERREEETENISLSDENKIVVENINKKKEEIISLINNIRGGSIRTKIHTTLPYKLTNTNATIRIEVDGIEVEVGISNHSQGSSLPMVNIAEGSTMSTTGPSKWTTTTCELDIEAHCLINGLQECPMVTLMEKDQERYWTVAFDFTYRVISAIWSYFQQHEKVDGSWPPLPNDIQYIHYHVYAGNKEYDGELSTNPALIYHVSSLKKEPKHYEIGKPEMLFWSIYTFMLAKLYAESGQLKEALFWLNVSTEALVEEFVQRIALSKEMLMEIEGDEHKFDTAEEILSEQFPDMKGKVKWPETIIHTSVFTKLKRALKISGMTVNQKDILKKYSQINAKRNNLFHGGSAEITIYDIEKAFDAYIELKECLQE